GAVPVGADPLTRWRINWGDGTSTDRPSDATSATHTYRAAPTAPITVTAFDAFGSGTASKTVSFTEGEGTVNVGGPYAVHAGDNGLVLSATSYGSPTSFAWDVNGDGNFSDATGSNPAPVDGVTTSQVALPWATLQAILSGSGVAQDGPQVLGNLRVRVTYADGNSVTSAPAALTILDTPPTATFSGTDATVGGASTVSFAQAFSPSAALTAAGFTYAYDFNEGTFDPDATRPSASVPAELLAHAATHVIHGRITDAAGGFTDYTTTITVADVAPRVTVGPDQTVAAGTPVSLVNAGFSYPGYTTPGQPETFSASIDWG